MKFPLNFQHQYTKCFNFYGPCLRPRPCLKCQCPRHPSRRPRLARYGGRTAHAHWRLTGCLELSAEQLAAEFVFVLGLRTLLQIIVQQHNSDNHSEYFYNFEHNSCKFCKFCKFLIGGNPKWQPTDTERDIETCCFLPVLGESYTDPRAAASDGNETRSDTKQQKSLKMLLNAEMVKLFWREW